MKFNTVLIITIAIMVGHTQGLWGWWQCPEVPPLDDGLIKLDIEGTDVYGNLNYAQSVDLNMLKDKPWYELIRDGDFDDNSECVQVVFNNNVYDQETDEFEADYNQSSGLNERIIENYGF